MSVYVCGGGGGGGGVRACVWVGGGVIGSEYCLSQGRHNSDFNLKMMQK